MGKTKDYFTSYLPYLISLILSPYAFICQQPFLIVLPEGGQARGKGWWEVQGGGHRIVQVDLRYSFKEKVVFIFNFLVAISGFLLFVFPENCQVSTWKL